MDTVCCTRTARSVFAHPNFPYVHMVSVRRCQQLKHSSNVYLRIQSIILITREISAKAWVRYWNAA